ncbi:bifunctional riboflavin kinase/FAD synthetase [Photobacterium aphoticum]|uniref:Riboflavin biosynthesis protein n=2 Tax=Photobacterium aphoticum TaxID=754436 RepID=A0A0J1GM10_9GAMM|nr:bifunctional riboflavin kinase/FAD synthetase [Photobacterium aphoticum]KLV00760.1 FMN adenylyltransferase [Photobacterium aphoticum]PSU58250.1 bifunctional riboflavin kinase/FAD synthetase [Photobacterium aphoticum]GHA50960.1 riboflavin biosynthesis protein [Photobacterium aphoticum]
MELIRGIHNIQPQHRGCVLTIGNFDGVHLGHQAVLRQVMAKAEAMGCPATVMSFEPQPQELFAGDNAPARLTRFRDKYLQLKQIGLDRFLCVNFNHHFARQTPEDFVRRLLVEQLGVKFLVVGDDFRFGQGRKGDFAMLEAAGKRHGFTVVSTQSFCVSQQRVSSTAIRQALANDELALAESMLGRPFAISGRVSHGRKLGRTIGFPTANVPLKRRVSPVSGVYAVDVYGVAATPLPGVANVGRRPTVNGVRRQLEVHLFDFQSDLYGAQIEVVLRHKLRDEIKFESFSALQAQIERDAQSARVWLAERNNVQLRPSNGIENQ